MPKHKPKRSAPSLDMTAMCDVAFLLLTFFMLTAKAKPQEAVVVDTPSSISETKLPDAGTLTILLSKEGEVFLDMAGSQTRYALAKELSSRHSLGLTEEEALRFAKIGSFGVSRSALKGWLAMESSKRGEMGRLPFAEREKLGLAGIPIDTADINKSELADWIHSARLAQFRYKQEMASQGNTSIDEYVIVVKADKDTPYPAVQKVINTLVDINVNKFNLITSQEQDPNKSAAAKKEG